jgi:hypothetical protein
VETILLQSLIEFHAGLIAYRDPGNVEDSGEDSGIVCTHFISVEYMYQNAPKNWIKKG